MVGSLLKNKEDGTLFEVTKKLGKILVLRSSDSKKIIRRPERTILDTFEIVEDVKEDISDIVVPKSKIKREPRNNLNIKRVRSVKIDVEAVEAKARVKLAKVDEEIEGIQSLEFDYEIGQELLVPFTAIKLLTNGGRVDYMIQKLQSDDEWTKLMYYCWVNRAELKSTVKWERLEEVAIKSLGSSKKPKTLKAELVIKELDMLINYQIKTGLINYEYYTKIVEALPDGYNNETSYYLYAISALLFGKNEWGQLGLNKNLRKLIDDATEKS